MKNKKKIAILNYGMGNLISLSNALNYIGYDAAIIDNYKEIKKEHRIDFWMGIGTATWSVAIFSTMLGYFAANFLNKDMMIGLAIVNPIYFMCMMIGAMKTLQVTISIILGAILGPLFYFLSPEWCILYGGFLAGTIAFFVGEKNVN